jgi:hypothetical protein
MTRSIGSQWVSGTKCISSSVELKKPSLLDKSEEVSATKRTTLAL